MAHGLNPPRPDGATTQVAATIKQRLLERVADEHSGDHLTIALDAGDWQAVGPGLDIKLLHEADGTLSYLLRLAPGAVLPPHRHRADEECVVLSGQVRLGTRVQAGPGTYHLARRGSLHAGIRSDTGAVLFLRGARPRPDDSLS